MLLVLEHLAEARQARARGADNLLQAHSAALLAVEAAGKPRQELVGLLAGVLQVGHPTLEVLRCLLQFPRGRLVLSLQLLVVTIEGVRFLKGAFQLCQLGLVRGLQRCTPRVRRLLSRRRHRVGAIKHPRGTRAADCLAHGYAGLQVRNGSLLCHHMCLQHSELRQSTLRRFLMSMTRKLLSSGGSRRQRVPRSVPFALRRRPRGTRAQRCGRAGDGLEAPMLADTSVVAGIQVGGLLDAQVSESDRNGFRVATLEQDIASAGIRIHPCDHANIVGPERRKVPTRQNAHTGTRCERMQTPSLHWPDGSRAGLVSTSCA
mmetsp:Transcript_40313/g.115245  ORF Transcript_40313/g.115245 Transcript_40313/m.115245 type:complete len:318 (-) Transcript_40313:92-1045(-)